MAELLRPALHDAVPYSRPSTPSTHPQIGFVGLGAMGFLIARNLAKYQASHVSGSPPLLVWNRSVDKSEKLVETVGSDKVRIANDPEQIARECDVIITSLSSDAVVKSIYEKFKSAIGNTSIVRHKIFVETSTIYPSFAGELDALVSSLPHAHLVTSPVFGAPAIADKAQLLIIMSGDYRSKKELAYLLVPAIGRKVIDLGQNIEKAPTFKLLGNSMILGTLEILAEAYTLAEKAGIDAENVHSLVREILPAPGTVAYSDKMLHDKYDGTVGFAINGGIKDATHIRRLTAELNAPMPVVDTAHQHLLTARAIHTSHKQEGKAGFDTLDWSGIIAGTRVAAGLDGFDSQKHFSVVRED